MGQDILMQHDREDLMARHVLTLPLMTADPEPVHTCPSYCRTFIIYFKAWKVKPFTGNDLWSQEEKDTYMPPESIGFQILLHLSSNIFIFCNLISLKMIKVLCHSFICVFILKMATFLFLRCCDHVQGQTNLFHFLEIPRVWTPYFSITLSRGNLIPGMACTVGLFLWGSCCPFSLLQILEKSNLTGSLGSYVNALMFSDIAQSSIACVIVCPSTPFAQPGMC